eukprot:1574527-Rhodomonas_salina.1
MIAARWILKYLAGTTEKGLTYEAQPTSRANLLWGFADADHTGDPDTRRSVTGYVLMLAGAAVSWSSARQAAVALSSSEAEFYAASMCGSETTYFRTVLEQLRCKQPKPTIVFEDNWASIYMSKNAVLHHKTKHIAVLVYHLRDLVRTNIMTLLKIGTHNM